MKTISKTAGEVYLNLLMETKQKGGTIDDAIGIANRYLIPAEKAQKEKDYAEGEIAGLSTAKDILESVRASI
jgi:hypothetical protein